MSMLPRGVKRQIERLNTLTTGVGAIKLPQNVTRLELRFNKYVGDSSLGAKRFWRQTLPPIQFYNPQIPISVRRYNPSTPSASNSKPELIVEFADGSHKAMDATNQPKEAILKKLVEATGAVEIPEREQVFINTEAAE